MATDHYTRLKINKKVFDNLDEKGKKELIDKQFEKLKPKRWVELIPLNRFKLLESARDILKDSDLRQSYDHILENKFAKVNIQYSELKKISGTLKFMNKSVAKDKTVDHNNNQPQEQNKNLLPSPPTVSPDELQRIEKDLVVIKEQFEGMLEKARINVEGLNNKEIAKEIKGNALLELQHKTIQELEEKLKLNKKEPNSSVADHNNSQSQKETPPKPLEHNGSTQPTKKSVRFGSIKEIAFDSNDAPDKINSYNNTSQHGVEQRKGRGNINDWQTRTSDQKNNQSSERTK